MKHSEQVLKYLEQPESERNVIEGATLLLQANSNRILHANIVRNPDKYAAKLFYELDKYARVYLARETVKKVEDLESRAKLVDLEPTRQTGQRADHDALPAEIQQLWVDVLPISQEIRSYHEKLKLSVQNCDRVEYMELLIALDNKRRAYWERYDNYVAPVDTFAKSDVVEDVVVEAKEISAARSYLSKNKSKLASMQQDNPQGYLALLEKMQERVDLLVAGEATLTDEYIAELAGLGIAFK